MLKSAVLMARFSGSKVPLELVKQLRQQTNSPYSEVSRALQESGNDMEKALEWLKKKGLANAQKKLGKDTKNGVISIQLAQDRKAFSMIELNCETDFVAKSDVFLNYAQSLTAALLARKPQVSDKLQQTLEGMPTDLFGSSNFSEACKLTAAKLQQNVVVSKCIVRKTDLFFGSYIHSGYTKTIGLKGSVVQFSASPADRLAAIAEVGETLALQVLGVSPKYFSEEDVPKEVLGEWMEKVVSGALKQKLEKVSGEVREKMIAGKMRKQFYQQFILEHMGLVTDPEGKTTVAGFIKAQGLSAKVVRSWVWQCS